MLDSAKWMYGFDEKSSTLMQKLSFGCSGAQSAETNTKEGWNFWKIFPKAVLVWIVWETRERERAGGENDTSKLFPWLIQAHRNHMYGSYQSPEQFPSRIRGLLGRSWHLCWTPWSSSRSAKSLRMMGDQELAFLQFRKQTYASQGTPFRLESIARSNFTIKVMLPTQNLTLPQHYKCRTIFVQKEIV